MRGSFRLKLGLLVMLGALVCPVRVWAAAPSGSGGCGPRPTLGVLTTSPGYRSYIHKDVMTVHAEATSTSAADFTFSKVKPTVFKHEVKNSKVSGVAAEVVGP
jgi:hypothetical protein